MNFVFHKFKKCINMSFPNKLVPPELKNKLLPLDNMDPAESCVFGSSIAKKHKKKYLIQGDIEDFLSSCPQGYFLTGFWGHGVNSYAFYYSRVDSWSKIFFRLTYGGAYEDNELDAHLVRIFIRNFIFFEPRLKKNFKSLIAIESMGTAFYKIEKHDGSVKELKESLMYGLNWELMLG